MGHLEPIRKPLFCCGRLRSPMPSLSGQNLLDVGKATPASVVALPPRPRASRTASRRKGFSDRLLASNCRLLLLSITVAWIAGNGVRAEQMRLFDNTRVNVLIEAVAPGGLKVTTMDGETRVIPLNEILAIDFRGRERRMLLSGTQELRFTNGNRLRGRLLGQKSMGKEKDVLLFDTYSLGSFNTDPASLKGMVTLPRIGRVGRWADELVEREEQNEEARFFDRILDRRGSTLKGVINKFSTEGIEIDQEEFQKKVFLPTLYLAGTRFADADRTPPDPFPQEVFLRVQTRDGSLLEGWIVRIDVDRWIFRPAWNRKGTVALSKKEIVHIQVMNGKRFYLSQLKPVRVKESTRLAPGQSYKMDKSCQGNPLTIGKHRFPWGIGVHARSELTFKLPPDCKVFSAYIGLDAKAGGSGSVVFRVLGEGKQLFRSDVIRSPCTEPQAISIPLKGCRELTLIVEDAGDLDAGDMANWAAAQVLK